MGFFSKPKAKVITPGPSQAEIQLGKLASEQWDYYKQNFLPYAQKFVDATLAATDNKNTEAIERGMVSGQIGRGFDSAPGRMLAGGLNPNSGAFAVGLGNNGRARASAVARGLSGYDEAAHREKIGGLSNIVKAGRGQAGSAMNVMGAAGRLQTAQQISDQNAESLERRQNAQLLAQLAGGIGGAIGAYQNGQQRQSWWQGLNDRYTDEGVWGYDKNGVWGNSNGVGFEPYSLTWPPN